MTNVAIKAISARYGSNETLVFTSHSDIDIVLEIVKGTIGQVPTQRKVAFSQAGNFMKY